MSDSALYTSTRGDAAPAGFDDVLLAGLAPDGGLYWPRSLPRRTRSEWAALAGLAYPRLCAEVMAPFMAGSRLLPDLPALCDAAYAGFRHRAVVPLTQLDSRLYLLELFHGPTLAFKDLALQLLGRMFDRLLTLTGRRLMIVGATSGDTGSAALEACRDRAALDILVLYPDGRVSEVQRRQMTTIGSANTGTLAVSGTFDDCQARVKALFADKDLTGRVPLSAVNSINWARIIAQTAYYVSAALALGAPHRPVAFVVPTGNFGNILAAHLARLCGLPIGPLVVASNRNDVLPRFFQTGAMSARAVEPSLSPSMDIQVSSNFERLLFTLTGNDPARTAALMANPSYSVEPAEIAAARGLFDAVSIDDETTLDTIRRWHGSSGILLDPHSAIGVAAAERLDLPGDTAIVALGCAHPAKFPDAVEKATGVRPGLPPHLADLHDRPERVTRIGNDHEAIKAAVLEKASVRAS